MLDGKIALGERDYVSEDLASVMSATLEKEVGAGRELEKEESLVHSSQNPAFIATSCILQLSS